MQQEPTHCLVENLNALLRAHGMSRAELARSVGMEQTTLNRIFNAKEKGTSTTLETVSTLAKGLNVSVAELLSPSMNAHPAQDETTQPLVCRQLARLVEDFLLSTTAARSLEFAQRQAEARLGSAPK